MFKGDDASTMTIPCVELKKERIDCCLKKYETKQGDDEKEMSLFLKE